MSNEKLTTLEQLMKEMVNAWVIKSTSWDLVNTLNFFDNLDSEKVEALKNTLKEKWMFDELILLNQHLLRGLVRQYNMGIIWNKKIFDGSEFDRMVYVSSISTPDADKLKAEIKEAQKAKASKLVEEWKIDEAIEYSSSILSELVVQYNIEVSEQIFWPDWIRKHNLRKSTNTEYVSIETISTPEAIEWREKVKELQKARFNQLMSEWKFDEAIEYGNAILWELVIQYNRKVSEQIFWLDWIRKNYFDNENKTKYVSTESINTHEAIEWKGIIELANIKAFDNAIETWDYIKAYEIASEKFIRWFMDRNWKEEIANFLRSLKKKSLKKEKEETDDNGWDWRMDIIDRLLNRWSR